MRLLAALAFLAGCSAPALGPTLLVATFECDATPPIGHPLCGGWIKPIESVEEPLLLKGVVLSDGASRWVIGALDWCRLQTGAYDMFRRKMAVAVGIPETQVAVQTLHPHDAPIADVNAEKLLQRQPSPPAHLDLRFMEQVTDRAAAAAGEAAKRLRPFTHVGWGRAKVEEFASNRRVRAADGKMLSRTSASKGQYFKEAPEGLVDPWLRTVTLFDGERPVVRLHYYATHPMSFYGVGRATPDVPGIARKRLEAEEKIPHLYFTGCGGNVTAGKYNSGTPEDRARLTDRLEAAMRASIAGVTKATVRFVSWRTAEVRFALRTEPHFSEDYFRKAIADAAAKPVERLKAALALAWYERVKERPAIDISALRIGPVTILHLPGEAFIEYQLYAQSLKPDDFIAVAAYGECGPGYICTDAAFEEGGYEPTMSLVGPPSEARLKAAISELLR